MLQYNLKLQGVPISVVGTAQVTSEIKKKYDGDDAFDDNGDDDDDEGDDEYDENWKIELQTYSGAS